MMRPTLSTAAALSVLALGACVLALGACSGHDPGTVAVDPQAASNQATSTAPSDPPTVGTYPAFPHDDYSFTLVVGCYCPDAGQEMRITVVDGRATGAAWVRPGGHRGRPVPDYWGTLTMDDVIAAANDTDAALVKVDWPDGQDYPDSVYVDQDRRMVDEEKAYTVSDVTVG